jgi:ribosome biogenesis GTPase / thiamine phosphate phosphatase
VADPLHVVVWVARRHAQVLGPDGRVEEAAVSGRLRPVVGDRVQLRRRGGGSWVERIERRGAVLEKRARGGVHGHVLAANVDVLVIVTAVGEQFRSGLVDRFLVVAGLERFQPLLVVNKCDLVADYEATRPTVREYEVLGIPTVATSARSGQGLDDLRERLRGQVAVLAGHSGVGKSSLLNALVPGAEREVGEVSEHSGTGRHVTSSARGFPFEGGLLVDLPGTRLFGLLALEPVELLTGFPDLAAHAGACRFPNCSHSHEPGCSLRAAVESGAVARSRYDSYLRLLEETRAVAEGRRPS